MKPIKLNTSMENIKGKSPYLLLLPLFVIVLYMGYAWDILSLQDDLSHAQSQENDLKAQINRVITMQSHVVKDLTQLPQRKAQLAIWQKQVINYEQLPELLNNILSIGGSNQLYIKSFLADKEVEEGPYTKVPIHMTATGDYHKIATFISQIANMKWIVAERHLVISREALVSKDDKETRMALQPLNMEVELAVYYISLPKTPEVKAPPAKGAKPNAH